MGITLVATRVLFARASAPPANADEPPYFSLTVKTVATGALATMIGVSENVLITPSLAKLLAAELASATAAALTLPFALVATVGYLFSAPPASWGAACAGPVFLPAVAAVGMAIVLTAPLAARLKRFVPATAGQKAFAGLALAATLFTAASSGAISSLW